MRPQDERIRRAGGAMKTKWIFLLFLCLILAGCKASPSESHLISMAEGAGEYSKTLHTFLPAYSLQDAEDTLYAEVARGNAVTCFDVQAVPAVRQGVCRYWYPHAAATLVIAVDRKRTDAVITGWKSLRENQIPVGMHSTSIIRNMMAFGALSYGLQPDNPNKEDALLFLEDLNLNGGFQLNESDAPILLCLDYEAAAWNRAGEAYEIIIPREGTITYQLGLLSDVQLTLQPGLDDALLTAGFALINGDKPMDFPGDYQSAHMLEEDDYTWFFEVTGDSSRDIRRQVFHSRLYTTADLREHILSAVLISIIILLWKGTVSHRMARKDIRRIVTVLSWLMVGWLMLRLFKYQLWSEDFLCRMCWYGYYLFQLALPVGLLYLSEILDRADGETPLLRPLWPPFVCYALSVFLVMTNDLHQLVFRFDPQGNWNNTYSYGYGYWLVLAVSLLFLVLAIGKLFLKSYKNTTVGSKLIPLLFCLGLGTYICAYILRIPLAWESDLTVNICILSVLFFETALYAGLMPVNIQYNRLFASAPINLTLLDERGQIVLTSQGARPISQSIWKRLLTDIHQPLLRDSDTLLHAVPIRNGMAVWQEDLTQINGLKKEIQNVQMRLEAANALLREEEEIKKRLVTAETNRALFQQLDRDISYRISSLIHLIEDTPEPEHLQNLAAYITLGLCHIKRRCNLFFLARQEKQLIDDELGVYLDELVELAGYSGLQTLIRCGNHGKIGANLAGLCYDFAFETICLAIQKNSSPLMGYLETEGSQLVFRFLPDGDPKQWQYSDELKTAISAGGGQIICKDLDDALGLCLTIPLGGEEDG